MNEVVASGSKINNFMLLLYVDEVMMNTGIDDWLKESFLPSSKFP